MRNTLVTQAFEREREGGLEGKVERTKGREKRKSKWEKNDWESEKEIERERERKRTNNKGRKKKKNEIVKEDAIVMVSVKELENWWLSLAVTLQRISSKS